MRKLIVYLTNQAINSRLDFDVVPKEKEKERRLEVINYQSLALTPSSARPPFLLRPQALGLVILIHPLPHLHSLGTNYHRCSRFRSSA